MNYLLDTHVLLWAIVTPKRLPEAMVKRLSDERSTLWFSAASYWEICIKQSLGKLRLDKDWPSTMDSALGANQIQWLAISKAHCLEVIGLEHHHRDPFDRMLVAQARVENLVIATVDRRIQRYPVKTL